MEELKVRGTRYLFVTIDKGIIFILSFFN